MYATLLQLTFALFLLMDPLGNICLFLSILKNVSPKKRTKIILRELLIALIIIVCFFFIGDFVLNLIQVDKHTLLISGGIILFLISLQMIFPKALGEEKQNSTPSKEPFVVPLAIPLVAGPAVLAAVMLYSQEQEDTTVVLLAIFFSWLLTTLILLSGQFLQKLLGEKCLIALERLMGLLLTLISIQMFLKGLSFYIATQ